MPPFAATVTSATRRYTEICDSELRLSLGKLGSRSLNVCVGDKVLCEDRNGEIIVTNVSPRKNVLKRSYQTKTKELAANLDHLFIVSAAGPLYNPLFIDSVATTAHSQKISITLVINKIDQDADYQSIRESLDIYKKIGFSVIETSALNNTGLEHIKNIISKDQIKVAAFAGLSGVGKSSLLNILAPNAQARIQEVSERTGQGRQTTSQAVAYIYPEKNPPLFLIDLPGIQKFGISHLSEDEVRSSFIEFSPIAKGCQFSNCSHLIEPDCAVHRELKAGNIAQSRYDSYRKMIEEIKENEPY